MVSHLPPSVMLVDADVISRTAASNALERTGFNALKFTNGDEALQAISSFSDYNMPILIIINTNIAGMSAMEFCTLIKVREKFKSTPILILTEADNSILKAKGLENSFEDCLLKPFAQNDFVAKVRSMLSRIKPVLRPKIMSYKDIHLDLASYKVIKNRIEIHLGPTEFKILQCLIEKPNKIFSREDIMYYVWNSKSNVEKRTIDVHINRLRAALRQPNELTPAIKTVRSAGYCLELPGTR